MRSFTLLSITTLLAATSASAIPSPLEEEVPTSNFTITPVDLPAGHAEALEARHLEERQGSCTFQAFTGDACDGFVGAVVGVPPGGNCNDASSRNSFFLSKACRATTVTIDPRENCASRPLLTPLRASGCYKVTPPSGQEWISAYVRQIL